MSIALFQKKKRNLLKALLAVRISAHHTLKVSTVRTDNTGQQNLSFAMVQEADYPFLW